MMLNRQLVLQHIGMFEADNLIAVHSPGKSAPLYAVEVNLDEPGGDENDAPAIIAHQGR